MNNPFYKLTKEQKDELLKKFNADPFSTDPFSSVNPFEVFKQLFGNEKLTKTEQGAAKIFGSKWIKRNSKRMGMTPANYVRFHVRDNEPESFFGGKRFRPKTLATINKASQIISEYDMPLTVRQIYYQFVGRGLIENSLRSYKSLANTLCEAREQGLIPYEKIVDLNREPIKDSSWGGVKSFFETVKTAYRREINKNQPNQVEVWIEKQALTGVFRPITTYYDLYLCVGRGYPSLSALYGASLRLKQNPDKTKHIVYFGDFDPSGEDIFRDIQVRLDQLFGIQANFQKTALTIEDIEKYKLPPAPAKRSDSRAEQFISQHGDLAVVLDALPPDVLTKKVHTSILSLLDAKLFNLEKQMELQERQEIEKLITTL